MSRKGTIKEDFIDQLSDKYGDRYELMDEYINMTTKMNFKHKPCSEIVSNTPYELLRRKNECPLCNRREKFKEKFKKFEEEYDCDIDSYINNKIKIQFTHKICGNVFMKRPNEFLNGSRCRICSKGVHSQGDLEIVFKGKYLEYELLSDNYENNRDSIIKMKHVKCGHIFENTYHNFTRIQGEKCPNCRLHWNEINDREFKESVKLLGQGEYTPIDPYQGSSTKIRMKHDKCGFIYSVKPNYFQQGRRCPQCMNSSNGENIIRNKFKENDILFEEEYMINGKPFDFLIYMRNKEESIEKVLVEYDGRQHFSTKNSIYGGYDRFKNDAIKNDEVKDNDDYILLRIPYTYNDNDLNDILDLIIDIDCIDELMEKLSVYPDLNIVNKYIETNPLYFSNINGNYGFETFVEFMKKIFGKDDIDIIGLNMIKVSNSGIKYYYRNFTDDSEIDFDAFTINEIDWFHPDKKEILKSKIKYQHDMIDSRIYARKCKIDRQITSSEERLFLNKNHIQGYAPSILKIGLLYDDRLVALLTFARNRVNINQHDEDTIELLRYVTDIDHVVVGGFSRLLKHAKDIIKKEYPNITKIKTFSDEDISDGNLYDVNDFIYKYTSGGSYYYTDGMRKYNRFQFRKSELKDKYPEYYDDDLTEREIMSKVEGMYRISTKGNRVYEITI